MYELCSNAFRKEVPGPYPILYRLLLLPTGGGSRRSWTSWVPHDRPRRECLCTLVSGVTHRLLSMGMCVWMCARLHVYARTDVCLCVRTCTGVSCMCVRMCTGVSCVRVHTNTCMMCVRRVRSEHESCACGSVNVYTCTRTCVYGKVHESVFRVSRGDGVGDGTRGPYVVQTTRVRVQWDVEVATSPCTRQELETVSIFWGHRWTG